MVSAAKKHKKTQKMSRSPECVSAVSATLKPSLPAGTAGTQSLLAFYTNCRWLRLRRSIPAPSRIPASALVGSGTAVHVRVLPV